MRSANAAPCEENETMGTLQLLSVLVLPRRPWSRRGLATLGIVLTCLPLAAVLTLATDRVVQARRDAAREQGGIGHYAAGPAPVSMGGKMGRAACSDERMSAGTAA